MKNLPYTKEIRVFDKQALTHLRTDRCLLLDLTKLSSPKKQHFDSELDRHTSNRKKLAAGLQEMLLEGGLNLREGQVDHIRNAASKMHVIIYGFHEEIPQLVKALTEAKIEHWIYLSNTQHDDLDNKPPNRQDLEAFTKNLAQKVNTA